MRKAIDRYLLPARDLEGRARELAETLVNGNISDCMEGIAEVARDQNGTVNPFRAAAFVLMIQTLLPARDRPTLWGALWSRRGG